MQPQLTQRCQEICRQGRSHAQRLPRRRVRQLQLCGMQQHAGRPGHLRSASPGVGAAEAAAADTVTLDASSHHAAQAIGALHGPAWARSSHTARHELPGTRLHSCKACSHGHYCKGTHWLWVIAGRGAALPTPSREPHSRARRGCGRPGRRRCHRLGWGAPQRPGERGSGACAPCAACSSPGSPPCRRAPPGALSPAERLIAGGLTGAMPGAFARMPARAPTLLNKGGCDSMPCARSQ